MLYWSEPPQLNTRGLKFRVDDLIRRCPDRCWRSCVGPRARDCVANLAGDGERPRPIQAGRQIAEAFAELESRRVNGEALGTDTLSAAAAPFDLSPADKTNSCSAFLIHAIFEGRLQVLEPVAPVMLDRRAHRAS